MLLFPVETVRWSWGKKFQNSKHSLLKWGVTVMKIHWNKVSLKEWEVQGILGIFIGWTWAQCLMFIKWTRTEVGVRITTLHITNLNIMGAQLLQIKIGHTHHNSTKATLNVNSNCFSNTVRWEIKIVIETFRISHSSSIQTKHYINIILPQIWVDVMKMEI